MIGAIHEVNAMSDDIELNDLILSCQDLTVSPFTMNNQQALSIKHQYQFKYYCNRMNRASLKQSLEVCLDDCHF